MGGDGRWEVLLPCSSVVSLRIDKLNQSAAGLGAQRASQVDVLLDYIVSPSVL